ncbi:MAG: hypothetical protein E7625_06730 [Ruminococcaceae bacterium]|nr:hypothetical protein [Oscillospiraceae bacterium]
MFIRLICYVLLFYLLSLTVYGCYKVIWYIVKMISLRRFIRKLTRMGVEVEQQRAFLNIILGQRGMPDYIMTYQGKRYEISVLSYISTHGRWNIEKTRTRYLIESRRSSKLFYNRYVNSSAPDHVAEYKNELSLSRQEFHMSPMDPTYDQQIYLLYPYPKHFTYTDAHYNDLYVGDKVEGHIIMDVAALKDLFFAKT